MIRPRRSATTMPPHRLPIPAAVAAPLPIVVAALLAALASATVVRGQSGSIDDRTRTEHAQGGVTVATRIERVAYVWTVRNDDAPAPIVAFEVPVRHSSETRAPEGWAVEAADGRLRYRALDPDRGIRRGQAVELLARAPDGPPVRAVTVRLECADGSVIAIEGPWAPGPRPRSHVVLVVAILVAAGLVHARGARRAASAA